MPVVNMVGGGRMAASRSVRAASYRVKQRGEQTVRNAGRARYNTKSFEKYSYKHEGD